MAPPFGRGFPRAGPRTVIAQSGEGFGSAGGNSRGFGNAGGASPPIPPAAVLADHSFVMAPANTAPFDGCAFLSIEFGNSNSAGNLWERGELIVHWGYPSAALDQWETDNPTIVIDGVAEGSLGPGPPSGGDNCNVQNAFGLVAGNVGTCGLFSFIPEWHPVLPCTFADMDDFDARMDILSNVADPVPGVAPALVTNPAAFGFGVWQQLAFFGPIGFTVYGDIFGTGGPLNGGLGVAVVRLSLRDNATQVLIAQCDLTMELHA